MFAGRLPHGIHAWFGLSAGLIIALISTTGSLLVFYPEIDAALNPAVQYAEVAGDVDLVRAETTLRTSYPDRTGPWRLEVTGRPGAIPARYYNPPETAGRAFAPMMLWLSPDGREVVRTSFWGDYAMTFIYDLHYRLLAGEAGGKLVGDFGLAAILLVLTGLWSFWPRGSWAKALALCAKAHPLRRWRDIHKAAGLIGIIPLLMLFATGVMLALPQESEAVLSPLLGPPESAAPADLSPRANAADLAAALTLARTRFPRARLTWIETPGADGCCFRFRFQQAGDPGRRFPHSYVWVNRAGTGIVQSTDANAANAHGQLLIWLHPLHDGSFGGLTTRPFDRRVWLCASRALGYGTCALEHAEEQQAQSS